MQAAAVQGLLVDADDAEAGALQRLDDVAPALRVVPVFRLGGALGGDDDVGRLDRPAFVRQGQNGGRFRRVYAKDVGGRAVQADQTEIARLPVVGCVVEE